MQSENDIYWVQQLTTINANQQNMVWKNAKHRYKKQIIDERPDTTINSKPLTAIGPEKSYWFQMENLTS